MSKVARATLYRHFGSTTDLLAATFERLLPPVDTDIDTGPLRERLISLLTTQADLIDQAPVQMTTLAWLAMGPVNSGDASRRDLDPGAAVSLRERVIEQYLKSLYQILPAPDAPDVHGEPDTPSAQIGSAPYRERA